MVTSTSAIISFVNHCSPWTERRLFRVAFTGLIYRMAKEKLIRYYSSEFIYSPMKQFYYIRSFIMLPFISTLVIYRLPFCYCFSLRLSQIFWKNFARLLQYRILFVALLLFAGAVSFPKREILLLLQLLTFLRHYMHSQQQLGQFLTKAFEPSNWTLLGLDVRFTFNQGTYMRMSPTSCLFAGVVCWQLIMHTMTTRQANQKYWLRLEWELSSLASSRMKVSLLARVGGLCIMSCQCSECSCYSCILYSLRLASSNAEHTQHRSMISLSLEYQCQRCSKYSFFLSLDL